MFISALKVFLLVSDFSCCVLESESVELINRKITEQINASVNLMGDLPEIAVGLLFRAVKFCGVRRRPVSGDRLAWPYGTRFLGVVADGDYKVEDYTMVYVPRLRPGGGSINFERLLQDAYGIGVDLWTWIRAGAVGFKKAFTEFADEVFA
jgi:hypothetical protein